MQTTTRTRVITGDNPTRRTERLVPSVEVASFIPTDYDGVLFTTAESSNRKYTVHDAINAAGFYYKEFCRGLTLKLNLTSLQGRESTEKITLLELNQIADRIFRDSKHNQWHVARNRSY